MADSEALYFQVLEGYRKAFGHGSIDTIYSLDNIANHLQLTGKFVEAEEFYHEVSTASSVLLSQ